MSLLYDDKKSKNPSHIKIKVWGALGADLKFYLDEDTMRGVFEEHIKQIKKTGWIVESSKDGVYKGGVYSVYAEEDLEDKEEVIRGAI